MKIKHPMVRAIGEREFKKILDALPELYSEEYAENYKPIGMQLVWLMRHIDVQTLGAPPERLFRATQTAFSAWQSGSSRQEAVRNALISVGWGE